MEEENPNPRSPTIDDSTPSASPGHDLTLSASTEEVPVSESTKVVSINQDEDEELDGIVQQLEQHGITGEVPSGSTQGNTSGQGQEFSQVPLTLSMPIITFEGVHEESERSVSPMQARTDSTKRVASKSPKEQPRLKKLAKEEALARCGLVEEVGATLQELTEQERRAMSPVSPLSPSEKLPRKNLRDLLEKTKADEEIDFEADDNEPLEEQVSPGEALIDLEQEEKDEAKAKTAKKAEVEAKAKTDAGKGSKGPIVVSGGGVPKIRSEVVVPPRKRSPIRAPKEEGSSRPGPSKEKSPQPGPSGVCYPIGKGGASFKILDNAPKMKPILTRDEVARRLEMVLGKIKFEKMPSPRRMTEEQKKNWIAKYKMDEDEMPFLIAWREQSGVAGILEYAAQKYKDLRVEFVHRGKEGREYSVKNYSGNWSGLRYKYSAKRISPTHREVLGSQKSIEKGRSSEKAASELKVVISESWKRESSRKAKAETDAPESSPKTLKPRYLPTRAVYQKSSRLPVRESDHQKESAKAVKATRAVLDGEDVTEQATTEEIARRNHKNEENVEEVLGKDCDPESGGFLGYKDKPKFKRRPKGNGLICVSKY